MFWNNEISLADIISIIALIATLVTVFLILIQRHDAAKPVLFIRPKNSNNNQIRLTNYGIDFDLNKCPVELSCFGNNLAKKVCIESYFLLDKELSFYKTISIKGGLLTTHFEDKPLFVVMLRPSRVCFDAINCNEIINLNNELGGKLLGIVLCGFDAVSQRDDKCIPFSKSSIVLKLSYMDMYNKKYNDYAVVSFNCSSFSNNGMRFSFEGKQITGKVFKRYMKLYKKQNCCGWFGDNYIPSYDRK